MRCFSKLSSMYQLRCLLYPRYTIYKVCDSVLYLRLFSGFGVMQENVMLGQCDQENVSYRYQSSRNLRHYLKGFNASQEEIGRNWFLPAGHGQSGTQIKGNQCENFRKLMRCFVGTSRISGFVGTSTVVVQTGSRQKIQNKYSIRC